MPLPKVIYFQKITFYFFFYYFNKYIFTEIINSIIQKGMIRMFFSATLTDIYEIEGKYHITCMVDSDSGFKFNIQKTMYTVLLILEHIFLATMMIISK